MKIALIGDIHANLPALETVLEHNLVKTSALILNTGDSVGYAPFPDEVIKLLHKRSILTLAGNYDRKVLDFPRKKSKWKKKKHPLKYLAFKWAYKNLSNKSKEYIKRMPLELRLSIFNKHILLTHASPDSDEEHLYPGTSLKRFRELANIANVDIIIFGHSHVPFHKRVGNTLFINTGSVGRPDDGDPRAAFAIMDITTRNVSVKHYKLKYDIKRVVKKIRSKKLPVEFEKMFIKGLSLDNVL